MNNHDRRLKTVMVTKDIEKAFDTIWHAGLKYKLYNNFNLPQLTIKLLCSFLDDRKCYIKFLGILSECIHPQAGVPQGSGLSPTVFIMYTTDLPNPHFDDSLTLLYADDCTQLTRSYSIDDAVGRMNEELDTVSRWEVKWRIRTNPQKTYVTFLSPRRCDNRIAPVYLNNYEQRPLAPLVPKTNCTVLGLEFDRHLKFHLQATQKLGMARRCLAFAAPFW